jgi:hypothetical protein
MPRQVYYIFDVNYKFYVTQTEGFKFVFSDADEETGNSNYYPQFVY